MDKMLNVGADVPHAVGNAGELGIGAPGCLFVPCLFRGRGQPAHGVFRHHHLDLANVSVFHHHLRLLRRGALGVSVGGAEQQALFFSQLCQLFCLLHSEGEGFVTDHVDSLQQKGFGRRIVGVIGSTDDHIVNTVFSRRFLLRHFIVVAIQALPVQSELFTGEQSPLKTCGKTSSHQLGAAVKFRSLAMYMAD